MLFVGGGTETERLKQRLIVKIYLTRFLSLVCLWLKCGGVLELSNLLLVHLKKTHCLRLPYRLKRKHIWQWVNQY